MEQWQLSAGMFITSKTQGVYVMAVMIQRATGNSYCHTIKARHPANQLTCAGSLTPHNSPGERSYHCFSYS